jgi:hypothetical protein
VSRSAWLSILTVGALLTPAARAQLAIDWFSIDAGGAMFSTGSGFELGATIGQADAGPVLTGSGFELVGGFWAIQAAGPPPCPGDVNGDGIVDLTDLTALLGAFGSASGGPGYNPSADFDGSGAIDLVDLTTLLSAFGTHC